ncbi:MAG: hypothetical protein OXH52_16195 [Gammaproteobacteria bacterium]|nr:hypothetical protein [Gammaproteobacteria bacterium]
MTRTDEDSEIAAVVRKHAEARRRLSCLQNKAETYASTFRAIADALGDVARLKPARSADDVDLTELETGADPLDLSTPPEADVRDVIRDIRATVDVLTGTHEKLRSFGLD